MTKSISQSIIGLFLILFSGIALAQEASIETQANSSETFIYDQYYTIQGSGQAFKGQINLNSFHLVNSKFPLPTTPYNRLQHFGSWIHPDPTACPNTRAFVLQRDSKTSVSSNQSCTVTSGQWADPYSNQDFSNAQDIQIDHVVPLKNAYMTGAYEWNKLKRCLYANFLGNSFHLLSVEGKENTKKGDGSPSEYIPPNKAFTCQYLKHWLEIKFIWNLRLTPKEVQGIQNEIKNSHCSNDFFNIDASEANQQLDFIEKNKNLCVRAA